MQPEIVSNLLAVFCLQRVHFIIPRARGVRDAPSWSAAKYFQWIFDMVCGFRTDRQNEADTT